MSFLLWSARPFTLIVVWGLIGVQITTSVTTSIPTGKGLLDCDFEKDNFCNWTDPTQFGWVLRSGHTPVSRRYSPISDHTLENIHGHYVTTKAGYSWKKDYVGLSSPTIRVPDKGICFQFWYQMYGPSVADLKIYITPKNQKESHRRLVWERAGTQGPDWKHAKIHIQGIRGDAFITIETVHDKKIFKSHPALDDTSMVNGYCPRSDTCDFEDSHFCSYTQSTSDNFDWSMSSSADYNDTQEERFRSDHTFETSVGHYVFINASAPRIPGDKAELMTNIYPATTYSCLSFWYNLDGASMGTLHVKLGQMENRNNDNILWTKSGDQGWDWQLANVDVSSRWEYVIVFEGIVGDGVDGNIAIDDIRIKPGMCPEPMSCDFEEEGCTWRNIMEGDDFDWERVLAHHISTLSRDHTLNTGYGHFLYMDKRYDLKRGNTAKYINSPNLDKNKTYCLNLWYFIYVSGNLTIVTQDTVTQIENDVVFSVLKPPKLVWYPVRETLGPFKSEMNVVLISTIESLSFWSGGSIGIDDLAIQEGSCETLESPNQTRNAFKCSDGKFIPRREMCDFHNDCRYGEEEKACGYQCDFGNGTTCGWSLSKSNSAWKLQSGSMAKKDGGPNLDNTMNSNKGLYLYMSADPFISGSFSSPPLQRSAPYCEFTFSLFYQNASDGYFSVRKDIGTEKITLFKPGPSTEHGLKWRQVIVPMGLTKVPFRVEIVGNGQYDNDASIAIDDVFFKNCDYPQPFVSCTPSNTFECKNNACVHPESVCNFVDDCGDGSDEANDTCLAYSQCSFESGLCAWSQETFVDNFDWKLSNDVHHGPAVDHTTSTKSGHYIIYNGDAGDAFQGDKAWLLSPVLESNSDCSITFQLYMSNGGDQSFSVYTRSKINGPLTQEFSKTGGNSLMWMPVYIQIKMRNSFQIILEGVSGTDYSGTISIDDIVLSPGCRFNSNSSRSLPTIKWEPTTTPSSPCGDVRKWQCSDGSQCISKSELCDFIVQCDDGSDEKDCGACDFEFSMCGWQDKTKGKFIWDRVNASSVDIQGKPDDIDSAYGAYMLMHSKGYGYTRPALLESPILGSTEAGCSIHFYFKKFSYRTFVSLSLYPKEVTSYERDEGTKLWESRRLQLNKWVRQTVSVGARSAGFRMIFAFTENRLYPLKSISGVALDNITFSSDCGMGKILGICREGEFVCPKSKECKPFTTRCDNARDCKYGEDEEACQDYIMTDFEHGSQIFRDDIRDVSFYWELRQPSTSLDKFAPDRDHTFGNEKGHYMYISKAVVSSKVRAIARLKSPIMFGNREGTCSLRLFYHLNGNYTDAINVYIETKERGPLKLVWSANKEEGDEWKRASIALVEKTLFRVIVEGVRDMNYRGDIAIDDISFTSNCIEAVGHSLPPYFSIPTSQSCKKGTEFQCDGKCMAVKHWCDFKPDCKDGSDEMTCPSQCNFEGGMCGWKSDENSGSTEWRIERVKSGVDHNPGTSSGFILTTGKLHYGKKEFVLRSPLFQSSSRNCTFSFWYHSEGYHRIPTIKLRSFDTEKTISIKRMHSEDKWQKETAQLPPCLKDFELVLSCFSHAHSSPFLLDDFSFNGCGVDEPIERCKPGEFQCSNGLCIPEDRKCDMGNDCCDDSDEDPEMCQKYKKMTFETGAGGWKQPVGSKSFSRQQSDDDHTYPLSEGYIFGSDCKPGAATVTHEMPIPIGICIIRFWYKFEKTYIGNITVNAQPLYGELTIVASFSASPGKQDKWTRAEARIDIKEKYLLSLVGECSAYRGKIVFDDVVFSPGCAIKPSQQPLLTTLTPLPTNNSKITDQCTDLEQFQCVSDGHCISNSKQCDFNIDCLDRSDESGCNTIDTCNFDDDLCGWEENEPDDLNWVRGKSSDVPVGQGPRYDASGASGSYVYIKYSTSSDAQNQNKNQIASLRSSNYGFQSAAAGCAIEFYYFLHGSNLGTFSLKITNGFGEVGTLWQTTIQSESWTKVIVGIGRRTSEFYLSFVIMPLLSDSASFSGQLAIDKIHFSSSCMEPPVEKEDKSYRNKEMTYYRCARGSYVVRSQLCDGQDDCGDESDESSKLCVGYVKEDFESVDTPLGSLIQTEDDQLDWYIWNNTQTLANGMMGVDHTTGLPRGRYAYVTGKAGLKTTDYSLLLSRPFLATADFDGCEVRFFTLLPTANQTLQVGYRVYNSNKNIRYKDLKVGIVGSFWQQVSLTFDGVDRPFQIIFKASPGNPNGALAIDDVTFGPHCRPYHHALPNGQITTKDSDQQGENKNSSDDDDEGWKAAVGVVIGMLAVAALVVAILAYLHRTGRIGGIRRHFNFSRFGGSSSEASTNPVYFDGKGLVNVSTKGSSDM